MKKYVECSVWLLGNRRGELKVSERIWWGELQVSYNWGELNKNVGGNC